MNFISHPFFADDHNSGLEGHEDCQKDLDIVQGSFVLAFVLVGHYSPGKMHPECLFLCYHPECVCIGALKLFASQNNFTGPKQHLLICCLPPTIVDKRVG